MFSLSFRAMRITRMPAAIFFVPCRNISPGIISSPSNDSSVMSSTLGNKRIQPLDQEQEEKGLECANSSIFLEKALLVMLVTTARRTEGIPAGVIFTPVILGKRERERDKVNQASQDTEEDLAHLNVAREGFDRRMETRKGTAESPRGLCEISSSVRAVNEAKTGGG